MLIGGGERDRFNPEAALGRVSELLTSGVDRMDAIKQTAREFGTSKREIYRLVEQVRSNTDENWS